MVGAILAVPFAAVIKIVLREAGAPRRARMAALREPEPAAPPVVEQTEPPGSPILGDSEPPLRAGCCAA